MVHDQVELIYRLALEDPDQVIRPAKDWAPNLRERGADLWKSTCAEIFVAGDGDAYDEFNFSPDGRWDAFSFSSYRKGDRMNPTPKMEAEWRVSGTTVNFQARILGPAVARANGLFHPTLVLETQVGILHWAPRHPPGKPDFHLREYFLNAARD